MERIIAPTSLYLFYYYYYHYFYFYFFWRINWYGNVKGLAQTLTHNPWSVSMGSKLYFWIISQSILDTSLGWPIQGKGAWRCRRGKGTGLLLDIPTMSSVKGFVHIQNFPPNQKLLFPVVSVCRYVSSWTSWLECGRSECAVWATGEMSRSAPWTETCRCPWFW